MDTFQAVGRYSDEFEADTAFCKLLAKLPYIKLAKVPSEAPQTT